LRTGGLFVTFAGTVHQVYPGVMFHLATAVQRQAGEQTEAQGGASAGAG